MEIDDKHRELALDAIDAAFKAKIRQLYDVYEEALLVAEDATDVETAEQRLSMGLEKSLDASRRIRDIAGLGG